MREIVEATIVAVVFAGLVLFVVWLGILITGFPGFGLAACGNQGGF